MFRNFIALLLFAIPVAPGYAGDACETQYKKLEELVQTKFQSNRMGAFPKELEISVTRKDGDGYLKTAQKLWSEYWPDNALISDLKTAQKSGKLNPKTMESLKLARARLKIARFMCEAICEVHASPPHLDELVKAMGKLEEIQAFSGDPAKVSAGLGTLRDALDDKSMKKVLAELSDMQSAGRQGNEEWLKDAVKLVKKSVDRTDLSEKEFHEVRKTIGRIQTIVLFDGLKNNDDKKLAAFDWLRKLYDQIGTDHDGMVKMEYESEKVGDVMFSDDIKVKLKKVLSGLPQ